MWVRQMRCGRVCGAATSRRSLRRTNTGCFSLDGTDLVIATFDSADGGAPSGERWRRSNIPIHERHHQFVDLVRLPPLASCWRPAGVHSTMTCSVAGAVGSARWQRRQRQVGRTPAD
jgi:hypothetical protein